MKLFPFFNRRDIKIDKKLKSNVDRINQTDMVTPRETAIDTDIRKEEFKHNNNNNNSRDEAKDHFESLKNSADLVNKDLEKNNSQFRFYIYKEFEEVFINLVRLNSEGIIDEIKQKNITHQEFSEWIRHIEEGEGLFFDSVG